MGATSPAHKQSGLLAGCSHHITRGQQSLVKKEICRAAKEIKPLLIALGVGRGKGSPIIRSARRQTGWSRTGHNR
jgi:hypothetical protein